MKNTITFISLSFLAFFLLAGCVNSSSKPVKSESSEYTDVAPSNWVKFGRDENGDVYFYEKGNLERDSGDNVVRVWEKNVLSAQTREFYIQKRTEYKKAIQGWEKLSEIKSLTRIDCNKQVYRTSSIIFCNTSGRVLDFLNFSESDGDWKYIPPDSRVDMLRKEVCK